MFYDIWELTSVLDVFWHLRTNVSLRSVAFVRGLTSVFWWTPLQPDVLNIKGAWWTSHCRCGTHWPLLTVIDRFWPFIDAVLPLFDAVLPFIDAVSPSVTHCTTHCDTLYHPLWNTENHRTDSFVKTVKSLRASRGNGNVLSVLVFLTESAASGRQWCLNRAVVFKRCSHKRCH